MREQRLGTAALYLLSELSKVDGHATIVVEPLAEGLVCLSRLDLLHALEIGGADTEGDCRHPELWKLSRRTSHSGSRRGRDVHPGVPRDHFAGVVRRGREPGRGAVRVEGIIVERVGVHEDEEVVGRYLVSAHLLRCACGVAGQRFAHFQLGRNRVTELVPEAVQPPALWSELDRERRERVWKTVDRLNATLGRETVRTLSAGPKDAAGKLRAEYWSPRWTTRWEGMPKVRAWRG